jgi:hypothetical protein
MRKVLRCMLLTAGLALTFLSALPEPEAPLPAAARVAAPTNLAARLAVPVVEACLGIDFMVLR